MGAAFLLNQGAALDTSWTTGPSRPKAIWARHLAEVKRGAPRIHAGPASCEHIFRGQADYSQVDSGDTVWHERPACAAVVKKTGNSCKNHGIYLGSGAFTSHCHTHLTQDERAEYLRHRERVDLQRQLAEQVFLQQIEMLTRAAVERWMNRRYSEERSWDLSTSVDDERMHARADGAAETADDQPA